ncbi:MAG: PQQ-binding-like beta-propeller repeat protein [Planctomycetaceae bacterium]
MSCGVALKVHGWRFRLGLVLALLVSSTLPAEETHWARFRGENGTGRSSLKGVPTEWASSDYAWVKPLPGKGHSSPVIWGEKLFVTAGHEDGKRTLLCLSAATGEEVWTHTMTLGANHLHLKNSYASGTPAVDGSQVYAAFADDQHYVVTAYTFDGDEVWTKDLGTFTSQHGQGVSPIVVGELVIVPNDQRAPSSIVALNKTTGEQVWATQERAFREASYATPILVSGPSGADQLVCVSGATGVTAYDPKTGAELWTSGALPMRTCGSPIYGEGVVIATCGQGGNGKFLTAVEPADQGKSPKVRYTRERELPYVPTPIAHNGQLYLWLDSGVVCCVDMTSGENIHTQRVGGKFSGSPVLIDGKLYCISEGGEIVVVNATPALEVLGRSPLGDESYSTPAVAQGRVYFRGFHSLACLSSKSAAKK